MSNSILLYLISFCTGIMECFAATNSCIFKECLMSLKMRHFPSYPSIYYLQLTLEQHEFETCRSTYMWIFFFNVVLQIHIFDTCWLNLIMWNQIQRIDYKDTYGFLLWEGSAPLNSRVIQGSTVCVYNINFQTYVFKK